MMMSGRLLILCSLFISSVLSQDYLSEKNLFEFRQGAEATVGVLFYVTIIAIVFASVFKFFGSPFVTPMNFSSMPQRELSRTLLRIALFVCTTFLMIAGFFHFFGTEWLVGYQTAIFAAIGFYAVWTEDRTHMFLYLILSIFNWFCVSGKLALFGYTTSLAELTTTGCFNYFSNVVAVPPPIVESRCITNGFINYLRLVGLGAIVLQGVAAYLAYRLYNVDVDTRGEYTAVGDGVPSAPVARAGSRSPKSGAEPSLNFSSPHQEGYQSGSTGEERFDDNVM